MIGEQCTEDCAAMPECLVCYKTKRPTGRSVPLECENGYCDFECRGYGQEPKPGHLWPNEWREHVEALDAKTEPK